jgi:PAS domain S-box-containing protein
MQQDGVVQFEDLCFQAAFDQAAVPASITSPDGRWLRVNRSLAELLGYTERELLGRTFQSLTHPDDLARNLELLRGALRGETDRYSMEKRMVHALGHTIWVSLSVSVVRADSGELQYLVTQYRDLTDHKRAELQLRASEERFTHVATNLPGLVYQYAFRPDGTSGYTFVNEGARSLFGVAPEDAVRDASLLLDLIHPADRAEFSALARHHAVALGELRWEGRAILASGDVRVVQVAARNQRQPDGTVLSVGVITDVTELREATRRLEESKQRYRSLFDHNPNAVFSLDVAGHFHSANPACRDIAGYDPDDLLGTSFAPLIVPEDLETALQQFSIAVKGSATQFEVTILHKSGRRVRIGVTNVPIIVDGRVTGVFGIARDLTVQRELEQQLRQAQKMEAVGRLAGGVAHDFNNLLTVITSYTQMAIAEMAAGSTAERDLREVEAAASRAASLTRQLLAFSRRQVLKPQVLDANQTVTGVAAMLRRLIGEDVALLLDLVPELWQVSSDPGQLEQVLMNLAVNARDAMRGGGTLRLRTANCKLDQRGCHDRPGLTPGEYVAIVVEDTGTGIDPAVLPHIFEPFFTTKPVGHGTGLGLATVYGIVKQSGGFVYAESVLGEGSRFTVLLPRVRGVEAATPASGKRALPGGTETILVVEDEAGVRSAVRRMLGLLGYTVFEAASASEALRLATDMTARGAALDLVLTDVVMPGLNGRALGEQLAELRRDLKLLYMSGYTDDEILRRGLAHSGISLLEKPFTMEHLAEMVRRVLDHVGAGTTGEHSLAGA